MGWLSNYIYRRQMTVDHTKVSSTLTNFPVLIHLTSSNFTLAHLTASGQVDLRFTDTDGTTLLNHQIEATVISVLTYSSDVFTGGTASASSTNGSEVASNAFDDSGSTFWTSVVAGPLPAQLQYDLGSGITKTLRKYDITSRQTGDGNGVPTAWTFDGSNNGSTWTTLDTQSGISWSDDGPKSYTFSNSTAYRYYRLNITATTGSHYVQIRELDGYELVDPGGNLTDVYAWVQLPTASSSSDTQFYMYYDYSSATDASTTAVWDSNHKGVWHLDESGNGTSGEFKDKTSNANNGTAAGTVKPLQATGKIYDAQSFTNGKVSIADNSSLEFGSGNITFSFKVKHNSTGGNRTYLGRDTDGSSYFYFALEGGVWRFRDYNSGNIVDVSVTPTLSTGVWYDIEVRRNGNNFKFFLDGSQVGTTQTSSGSFLNRAEGWDFGGQATINYMLNGYMDEVRMVATDLGDSWMNARIYSDNETLLTYGSETIDQPFPSVLILASSLQSPTTKIDCTILPSILTAISSNITPTGVGSTTIVTPSILTAQSQQITPTVIISATVLPSILTTVSSVITPTEPGLTTVHHASKILSFNPLIIVTSTSPMIIAKVDVTDPTTPIYTTYTITGANGATDVAYNSTLGKVYVSCEDGKIVEFNASDFSSYSIINTGVSTNFLHLASLDSFFDLFASSDYSLGEIVNMYEGSAISVATDIRFSQTVNSTLDTRLDMVNGVKFNTDFRWSQTVNDTVGCDIRFHTDPYTEIAENPIARTDFHVWVDGTELTDVKLDSIQIYHTEGEKSRATFLLARRHDKINYKLDGTLSQITNQNHLQIYIQSHLEFDGYIWDVDCRSENETVQVTGYTTLQKPDNRTSVTISIPGVNEKLHVYHALVHNPHINNPYILPDDINPPLYKGIQVDLGYDVVQNFSKFQFFGDIAALAADVGVKGGFQPKQNWTYFWFAEAENFITGTRWATLNYLGTSPTSLTSDTWQITGLSYYYQRQFPDIKTRLGTGYVYATDYTIEELNAGAPIGAITGASVEALRTTLETSDLGNQTIWHNILDVMESKLGYFVGSAPYKKVSTKSGRLTTKDQWVDKPDGLYRHRDASYNYLDYAKAIAALEYKKIQNINGQVLPETSADVELFIDGYYYFGISLLKRLNIDNTTESGIYDNANGFPVSVKTIEINSQTMKVTMRCDNKWSREELLEIEATYPNPDANIIPEQNKLNFPKFNPNTQNYIE